MSSPEDSSGLSSAPSEDELIVKKQNGILKFFSKVPPPSAQPPKEASPPRPKREPSPPHEYVLADNQDIAFIVMFRSRFTEAFPKSLINFGPQELERDIIEGPPGEGVEHFLCALLGLLLNRKQDVKAGHYGRALEDAITTHKSQWPKEWESKSPLAGGSTFATMVATERLTLLRNLILWSLSGSEVVKGIIQAAYKQNRHEDDINQALSVQPWGSDSDKRRYYLIEGLDDTHFRVYRESNFMAMKRTWFSVAGDIDELKALAEKLDKEDRGQKARTLSARITAAIPRFEATEDKRKRREYRQVRKNQFKRPEPNYSLYEGRTRGKRMKYSFSDDEDDIYSDSTNARRSTRNTGTHTPAEPAGPTITQSGRQVKSRQGGAYGETILSGAHAPEANVGRYDGTADEQDSDDISSGRPRRAAASTVSHGYGAKAKGGRHIEGYNHLDEMTSDEEADASEQDYGDDEEEDDVVSLASDIEDQDDHTEDDSDMDDSGKKSLVVKLPVKTPTPERKTTVKLLSEEGLKTNGSAPATSNATAQATALEPMGKTQPVSSTTGSSSLVGHSAKPIDFVPKSPKPQPAQLPMSPSLAFRGSPEKASTLPPSIGIGSVS